MVLVGFHFFLKVDSLVILGSIWEPFWVILGGLGTILEVRVSTGKATIKNERWGAWPVLGRGPGRPKN